WGEEWGSSLRSGWGGLSASPSLARVPLTPTLTPALSPHAGRGSIDRSPLRINLGSSCANTHQKNFRDGAEARDAIGERPRQKPSRIPGEDTMNEATRIPPAAVELGASGEEFQNLHEFVRKARANLNQKAWDYIVGAAETETTMRRNRMALDEIAFRPRVLRSVAKVDASVEVFGRKLRLPVMLAPVGALEMFDPGAGASVARGAGTFGAAHMLSSVTEPGLEKVAEAAPDALRIFQLYVRGGDAFVEDCVGRAISSGYTAFCLTVDTAHYSRRERDIAKRYVRASRVRATGGDFQKGLEGRTVELIKDKFKIPLILKGIATAEDTAIALDHGVDWIYVSNHGGRQLDHGPGATQVPPKSLKPAEGGVCGCLGLLGMRSFAELDKSYLHPATPTNLPHVFSAFPLLEIEPYRD